MTDQIAVDVTSLNELSGETMIITGGSSGIGLAVGTLLHSLGANVVIGDLNPPPWTSSLSTSDRAIFVYCDVTKWDSLLGLFDEAKAKFGYVDIVCPNAGINAIDLDILNLETYNDGEIEGAKSQHH